MSDFLKNMKSNDRLNKEKNRASRQVYRDHIYKSGTGQERRGERDRRNVHHKKQQQHQENPTSGLGNFLPEIKKTLDQILENQKSHTQMFERMTAAEEGVNSSLIKIAEALCTLVKVEQSSDVIKTSPPPISEPSEPTIPEPDYNEYDEETEISAFDKDAVIKTIVDMREDGATFDTIALHLETKKIPTFSNRGKWHAQTIHRLYSQNRDSVLKE